MKVYELICYYSQYESDYTTLGLFSSYFKAKEYLKKYIEQTSFNIESDCVVKERTVDPDDSWMEEAWQ